MRRGVKRRRVPKSYRKIKRRKVLKAVKSEKKAPTKYHEVKTTFTKKKASKSSKRQALFARRVKNIIATVTGLKTAMSQQAGVVASNVGAQQIFARVINGGAVNTLPDLNNLLTSIDPTDINNVTLKLHSSEIWLEVCNVHPKQASEPYTFNVGSGDVPQIVTYPGDGVAAGYVYMTWYHIVSRFDADATTGGDYAAQFTAALTAENTLAAPFNVAVNPTTYGVTPFDAPNFCTKFKIVSIKEVLLAPGQSYRAVIRSTKTRYIQGARIVENAYLKGITEGWLLVFHGDPIFGGTGPNNANLSYSSMRKYHYHHIVDDDNAIGHT